MSTASTGRWRVLSERAATCGTEWLDTLAHACPAATTCTRAAGRFCRLLRDEGRIDADEVARIG